jgi:hypothetical protein
MLRAGRWEAGLLPDLGGAIAYLTHNGRDVLRRAPEGVDDPPTASRTGASPSPAKRIGCRSISATTRTACTASAGSRPGR